MSVCPTAVVHENGVMYGTQFPDDQVYLMLHKTKPGVPLMGYYVFQIVREITIHMLLRASQEWSVVS